jgi:hypothetical protein
VGSQAWTFVTAGTDLDQSVGMRVLAIVATLFSWPLVVWHSQQARRRLRAYALPAGDGRLTLERVA